MDLIAVRLAAGAEARNRRLSPETVADVLWASALPGDRLEHVRARWGPAPGTVDVVLFHLPAGLEPTASDTGFTGGSATEAATEAATGPPAATAASTTAATAVSTTEAALRLCRRALHAAPSLAGWGLTPLGPTEMSAWP
jgi:hypothetical protein